MSVRVNCPYGCGGVLGHDESPSCPVDWIISAATRVSAHADVPLSRHFGEALHDLDDALAAHERERPIEFEYGPFRAEDMGTSWSRERQTKQAAGRSGDSLGASDGRSGETPIPRAMPDDRDRRTVRQMPGAPLGVIGRGQYGWIAAPDDAELLDAHLAAEEEAADEGWTASDLGLWEHGTRLPGRRL